MAMHCTTQNVIKLRYDSTATAITTCRIINIYPYGELNYGNWNSTRDYISTRVFELGIFQFGQEDQFEINSKQFATCASNNKADPE